ncbi:hypothetical protein GGTG_04721 [Gaeumannomyces tritici R3-111a-1]|uniref:Uncharacterized protein n=1 Tax=Gaeumannomyces tritici (strain R3-111a-1) TaxID=644352 RepID=J3NTX2_GAET3|nr:hypothetical protein GGTG_04721 [Gaeumannomyces tritici R3-111a-1]EJT79637.1 hypothetical protein GGTG_04721 [Gaeumannomyces tritici R3-111a-1]
MANVFLFPVKRYLNRANPHVCLITSVFVTILLLFLITLSFAQASATAYKPLNFRTFFKIAKCNAYLNLTKLFNLFNLCAKLKTIPTFAIFVPLLKVCGIIRLPAVIKKGYVAGKRDRHGLFYDRKLVVMLMAHYREKQLKLSKRKTHCLKKGKKLNKPKRISKGKLRLNQAKVLGPIGLFVKRLKLILISINSLIAFVLKLKNLKKW